MPRKKHTGGHPIHVCLLADDEDEFFTMAKERGLSASGLARELIHQALSR